MPLKSLFARVGPIAALFFCLSFPIFAAPPTLVQPSTQPTDVSEVRSGTPITFHILYKQAAGDAPKSVSMIVVTPSAQTLTIPTATPPVGDAEKGIDASFSFSPADTGLYRYHFETASETSETARYPAAGQPDLELSSFSQTAKYISLIIGLIVALLFLPFVVYVAARAINKRGNPAAAARVALMIGILASFGFYWFLFGIANNTLGITVAAIAAVAFIIILSTRK